MPNLIPALGLEREYIADKLADSLAKLLTQAGVVATPEGLREAILDRNTTIAFPNFTIRRVADIVVVEVVVTEVVISAAGESPRLLVRREIQKPERK
jgi:hypothetical protein